MFQVKSQTPLRKHLLKKFVEEIGEILKMEMKMNSDDEDNCCIRCSNSIESKLNNCTLALAERLGIRDLA